MNIKNESAFDEEFLELLESIPAAGPAFDADRCNMLCNCLRSDYKVLGREDALDIMRAYVIDADAYAEYDFFSVRHAAGGRIMILAEKKYSSEKACVWLIDESERDWLNKTRLFEFWQVVMFCAGLTPASISRRAVSRDDVWRESKTATLGKYRGMLWTDVIDSDLKYASWAAYSLTSKNSAYVIRVLCDRYLKLLKKKK